MFNKKRRAVIPPHQSSDFVVCMDESPKQMITETRLPIPMKPRQDAREDFEYARCGVANIFLASEPLTGKDMWRGQNGKQKQTGQNSSNK